MAGQEEWIDDVRRWCFDGGRAAAVVGCDAAPAADTADTRIALVALPPGPSQVVATLARGHNAKTGPSRSTT